MREGKILSDAEVANLTEAAERAERVGGPDSSGLTVANQLHALHSLQLARASLREVKRDLHDWTVDGVYAWGQIESDVRQRADAALGPTP